jgi:elongation factor P hydroxylase
MSEESIKARIKQVSYICIFGEALKEFYAAADRIEAKDARIAELEAENAGLATNQCLHDIHCDDAGNPYCPRIAELEASLEKQEAITKDDAKWMMAYHQWCVMNGFPPSSSNLIAALHALVDTRRMGRMKMSDLVTRLRGGIHISEDEAALRSEAAARIAELEAALNQAKQHFVADEPLKAFFEICAALEGKKDDQ